MTDDSYECAKIEVSVLKCPNGHWPILSKSHIQRSPIQYDWQEHYRCAACGATFFGKPPDALTRLASPAQIERGYLTAEEMGYSNLLILKDR